MLKILEQYDRLTGDQNPECHHSLRNSMGLPCHHMIRERLLALDLTDRFLPRLKARKLKPQLLPFLPYTAPQIASIITTRLQSLLPENGERGTVAAGYVPFLHPAAIQLCSKKVASQTGDLRKVFDICRRAIDLIESETKQKYQESLDPEALMLSPS
jgi:cell division control protein 6